MQWSTEQEYVYALLIQQLNMGSLSPAEIDWASAQMRAWGRKLEFEAVPRSSEGFYVDLASKRGLVRRTGNESGPTLHFLDTTPLADQLERAMHALRQTDLGEPGGAAAINLQRIAILEKVRPVVAPNLHGDLRRSPRTPVTVAAKVRVGLARICVELTPREIVEPANDCDAGNEQIEVFAVANGPRTRHHVPDEHDSLAGIDRAGRRPGLAGQGPQCRRVAHLGLGRHRPEPCPGGAGRDRQSDTVDWVLGAVRRLNKVSNDEVEAVCRSSPTASCRSPVNARRAPRKISGWW
jgi:hypothetical protein